MATQADGVEVIASLNLDAEGKPFEMDVIVAVFKEVFRTGEAATELNG